MPLNRLPAGWRRWQAFAVVVLAAGGLGGCFSAEDPNEHCDDVSEYQASRSVPGVVVPEGLAEPSRSSGLAVPPASAEAPTTTGTACLSRPPDFFRKDPPPAAE